MHSKARWHTRIPAGEAMTPEEMEFFKWYSHQLRELIQIDAITTPKRNAAEVVLWIVAGFVLHMTYVGVMSI